VIAMPTKTLKFLGRKRILSEHVQVEVKTPADSNTKRFIARTDLASYNFPLDATVWIDAKHLLETRRYSLGTVGEPRPIIEHDLAGFSGDRFVFSLVVINPADSRRLGSADAIRPKVANERSETSSPLLPVDASQGLDGLLWMVSYSEGDQSGAQDAPLLLIDREAAGDSAALFLSDPVIRAAIVPAAALNVLISAIETGDGEYDPQGLDWRSSWLRFGTRLAGEFPPLEASRVDRGAVHSWAAEAIRRLATRERMVANLIKSRGTVR
jgi:hypothetical protein